MNKQRKVLITITYNEMGIIIDTKAEEVAQPEKRTQERTETRACDLVSRQDAIDAVMDEFRRIPTSAIRAKTRIEALPSAQPEKRTQERTETHSCDLISRAMLLEYIHNEPVGKMLCDKYNLDGVIKQFPSAQPDVPDTNVGDMVSRQTAIDGGGGK